MQYNVHIVRRLAEVEARFCAVTAERMIANRIASAIMSAARRELFEGGSGG